MDVIEYLSCVVATIPKNKTHYNHFLTRSLNTLLNLIFFSISVGLSPPVPSPGAVANTGLFSSGAPSPSTLSALVSQHRLLELSRFGLRGYDLAQHMLTQQGAVSKLLGKLSGNMNECRKLVIMTDL